MLESMEYYLDIIKGDIPNWVKVSFRNQIEKRHEDSPNNVIINSKKKMGVFETYLSKSL